MGQGRGSVGASVQAIQAARAGPAFRENPAQVDADRRSLQHTTNRALEGAHGVPYAQSFSETEGQTSLFGIGGGNAPESFYNQAYTAPPPQPAAYAPHPQLRGPIDVGYAPSYNPSGYYGAPAPAYREFYNSGECHCAVGQNTYISIICFLIFIIIFLLTRLMT
jgi:hypothetical protein